MTGVVGIQEFAERFRIRRPVDLLSQEQRRAVHEAALGIMERTGVRINSEAARKALRNAGAMVAEGDPVVRFPTHVVLDRIAGDFLKG